MATDIIVCSVEPVLFIYSVIGTQFLKISISRTMMAAMFYWKLYYMCVGEGGTEVVSCGRGNIG